LLEEVVKNDNSSQQLPNSVITTPDPPKVNILLDNTWVVEVAILEKEEWHLEWNNL